MKAVYVVSVSDSSWPHVMGVHSNKLTAIDHAQSIFKDRRRWYVAEYAHQWTETPRDRELDPLFHMYEVQLSQPTSEAAARQAPETVYVRVTRCWLHRKKAEV